MKDQAAQLQSIGSRIAQCEESTHRVIEEVLPDLGLPPTGAAPTMIRVLVTQVRPDKVSEYLALVKGEVLPAAKKAGLKAYSVAQVRYGAPNTEFVSVAGLSNWADLEFVFPWQPRGIHASDYRGVIDPRQQSPADLRPGPG
jgi:hypothetical protein